MTPEQIAQLIQDEVNRLESQNRKLLDALSELVINHPVMALPNYAPEWKFFRPMINRALTLIREIESQ